MNRRTGGNPISHEAIIELLTKAHPKKVAIATMLPSLHAIRSRVESELFTLVAQGRVQSSTLNTVSTIYGLTPDEADKQGIKRENPVRNSTEPLYSRPTYTPPRMEPARHDANDANRVMSYRDGRHFPPRPPIGIASSVRGGA